MPRRRPYLGWSEIRASQADPGLRESLRDLLSDETTDDIEDPWERRSR